MYVYLMMDSIRMDAIKVGAYIKNLQTAAIIGWHAWKGSYGGVGPWSDFGLCGF
jgi:hypothetical protein